MSQNFTARQWPLQVLSVKASPQRPCDSTYALVFPIDVLQVKAFVALADVATKGVDAFPEPGAHRYSRCALINICKRKKKKDTGHYTGENIQTKR